MLTVPPELDRLYDHLLQHKDVAVNQRLYYKKWLRFYWDFCHKYAFEPTERRSFSAFYKKLRAKNQSEAQCKQAYQAVFLYYELVLSNNAAQRGQQTVAVSPPSTADKSSREGSLNQPHPGSSPAADPTTNTADYLRTTAKFNTQTKRTVASATRQTPPLNTLLPQQTVIAETPPAYPSKSNFVQVEVEMDRANDGTAVDLKLTGASWVWVYERLDAAIKVMALFSQDIKNL